MGLFDKKSREEKAPITWEDAYPATPKFYTKNNATPFGVFTLSEGVDTILPLNPASLYNVDNKPINVWELCLVSISKNKVLGAADFYKALNALRPYVIESRDTVILVRGLSLKELSGLLKHCS